MANDKWLPKKVTVGNASVKVYRQAHATSKSGWTYVLAYREAGARVRQKFPTPEAALAEARIKATRLNAGQIEGASMGKGDRDELMAARALCGQTPVLSALNEWKRINDLTANNGIIAAEAWAARNATALQRIPVEAVVKAFLKAKKAAGVDVGASYERQFPALIGAFGDRMIDTIAARELQSWLEQRYPHPVSRNTARKRMVALWRWSRKRGHLSRDAQTEAEQTDAAREVRAKIGVIDSKTYGALLRLVRDRHIELLAPLVLAGFAGLRRSEIHGQKWSDINLERSFLKVTAAKLNTPSHRIVPLSPAAVEWLLLCTDRTDAVCANLALDQIRAIARESKYSLPENCFRHSFISHRVAMTGNVAETALEAGNSPTIIFRHYRETFTKQEGEAWFAVGQGTTGQVIPIKSA